jgi:hypothetical protein
MINETRRTKVGIDSLEQAILDVVSRHAPMTVRQVFHQLVSLGLIEKTDAEYRGVVVRLLTRLRMAGSCSEGSPRCCGRRDDPPRREARLVD